MYHDLNCSSKHLCTKVPVVQGSSPHQEISKKIEKISLLDRFYQMNILNPWVSGLGINLKGLGNNFSSKSVLAGCEAAFKNKTCLKYCILAVKRSNTSISTVPENHTPPFHFMACI